MADDTGGRGPRGFRFAREMARMGRPERPTWRLRVVETAPVTPRMFSVSFSGDELGGFAWRPGQDLVLSLPQPDGSLARRHYTVRDFNRDARRLDIDFVLHGDSPAGRWALAARQGDVIEAQGPRGRTVAAPEAEQHLFLGDETCIPGIFAIAESLPARARGRALIEVDGPAETQPLHCAADIEVEWLFRRGAAAGPSRLLLDRLLELGPSPLGVHAYVIGETSNVRAQRHALLAMGFDRAQITAEGYWRPGRVGGHEHI
jgi:NADPH-dependent ferric siderophore reductase